jgi:hypothetical protein
MPAGTEISRAVLAGGHWPLLPTLLAGKGGKNGAKSYGNNLMPEIKLEDRAGLKNF